MKILNFRENMLSMGQKLIEQSLWILLRIFSIEYALTMSPKYHCYKVLNYLWL